MNDTAATHEGKTIEAAAAPDGQAWLETALQALRPRVGQAIRCILDRARVSLMTLRSL